MTDTTTSMDYELQNEKICSICKRKGHYASEHDDWVELVKEMKK